MEQQEQALLEGATACCETLSRLLCQDHQRANLAPGTGSHRIDILMAWGPRLDYLSAASPSPCHQTVIIFYTPPFFGALILHLSENIGTIACRLAIGRRGGIDQMGTLDDIGEQNQRNC